MPAPTPPTRLRSDSPPEAVQSGLPTCDARWVGIPRAPSRPDCLRLVVSRPVRVVARPVCLGSRLRIVPLVAGTVRPAVANWSDDPVRPLAPRESCPRLVRWFGRLGNAPLAVRQVVGPPALAVGALGDPLALSAFLGDGRGSHVRSSGLAVEQLDTGSVGVERFRLADDLALAGLGVEPPDAHLLREAIEVRAGDVRLGGEDHLVEDAQRHVDAELVAEVARPVEVGLVLDAHQRVEPVGIADGLADRDARPVPLALEEPQFDGPFGYRTSAFGVTVERVRDRAGGPRTDRALDRQRRDRLGRDGGATVELATRFDADHVGDAAAVDRGTELATDDPVGGLQTSTQREFERELLHTRCLARADISPRATVAKVPNAVRFIEMYSAMSDRSNEGDGTGHAGWGPRQVSVDTDGSGLGRPGYLVAAHDRVPMGRDTSKQWAGFTERGQSVFDFSIGVSLFLIVVLGVLVFVPTAFASFTSDAGGGAGDGPAAERAATYLAESALSTEGSPSEFDTGCALLMFTRTTGRADVGVTPDDCGFEPGAALASNASLDTRQVAVNVTIERRKPTDPGRQRLCWDTGAGLLDDRLIPVGDADCDPSSSDDVALTAGADAANNENYAVAERYGRFAGEGVYLVVRTW